MDDTIYIFGHKNPDTDSICSAIAYAHLKNTQLPRHRPARLGEINRETRFVLESFGVPVPVLLPHIHLRVQDVMTAQPINVPVGSTIHQVGELMRQHEIHAIPIVDEAGRALGAVTERSLARAYLNTLHLPSLRDAQTEVGQIANTLNGSVVVGDPAKQVSGNPLIGAMDPRTMQRYITPGDMVILGDRENGQEAALASDVSCLIITGGFEPSPAIRALAQERGVAIIVTPHDTFATAHLITLSESATRLLDKNVLEVSPENLVAEITADLLESKAGIALASDDEGKLVGIVTKSDIVARRRRPVILVDHSERSQSADGIERADILEILDHHRLGGLESTGPILALIAPVGCTATLILRRYREFGVVPPPEMAGLMLAALLSDTMLLKSPTTTVEDRAAVDYLGKVLGEEPLAFGMRMYNAKFDIARLSPTDLATCDLKTFSFGSATVGIGQVEVGDKETVLARKGEIIEAMTEQAEAQGFDLMLLMVTDILREGTELLAVGRTRIVERAFGSPLQDNALYLPGVLSRKKQMVPPIAAAL